MKIDPYLLFKGNAEEAFTFYKSVLGGEFETVQRFKNSPDGEKMAPDQQEMIMHIALPIGNGNYLMASDAPGTMGDTVTPGSNFNISLGTDSEAETDRIFNALAQGGQITMPLAKTFWGAYFGMLTDQFGIQWMISYDYKE